MEKQLDLFTASEYDLIVGKDRTLLSNITCTYLDVTGGTQFFDFSGYTGGTLVVKNSAGTILMVFATGSGLTLGLGGVFTLAKTSAEMDTIRAGQYNYDMYISSVVQPKRAFLKGKINFVQNIAN
jgi:altronate dehydratase